MDQQNQIAKYIQYNSIGGWVRDLVNGRELKMNEIVFLSDENYDEHAVTVEELIHMYEFTINGDIWICKSSGEEAFYRRWDAPDGNQYINSLCLGEGEVELWFKNGKFIEADHLPKNLKVPENIELTYEPGYDPETRTSDWSSMFELKKEDHDKFLTAVESL